MDAISSPTSLLQDSAAPSGPTPWASLLSRQVRRIDSPSLLRPYRQPAPVQTTTLVVDRDFFAIATHDGENTHVAALNAGSHWLLCSAREPTVRLAASLDPGSARQFATINDAYRVARALAPKALKFDIG